MTTKEAGSLSIGTSKWEMDGTMDQYLPAAFLSRGNSDHLFRSHPVDFPYFSTQQTTAHPPLVHRYSFKTYPTNNSHLSAKSPFTTDGTPRPRLLCRKASGTCEHRDQELPGKAPQGRCGGTRKVQAFGNGTIFMQPSSRRGPQTGGCGLQTGGATVQAVGCRALVARWKIANGLTFPLDAQED